MENRKFFDIFYDEQNKAEKITAFLDIKNKIDDVQSKVDAYRTRYNANLEKLDRISKGDFAKKNSLSPTKQMSVNMLETYGKKKLSNQAMSK